MRAILAKAEVAEPGSNLALLGDKRFLFSASGESFLMFGVRGRAWVALGAPVGRREERQELLWRFRELADSHAARPGVHGLNAEDLPEIVERTGDAPFVIERWQELTMGLGKVLLPVLGLGVLLAVSVHLLQVGPMFLPEKMSTGLFCGSIQLAGWAVVCASRISCDWALASSSRDYRIVAPVSRFISAVTKSWALSALDIPQITWFTWDLCYWTCAKIGLALFILAILDYAFQWWQHEHDLKMTPQEVREEMRNLQGDPATMASRRGVQRQLVLNRIPKAVPKADVVVTNPTELAVALQYDPATMAAPIVVAKGAG